MGLNPCPRDVSSHLFFNGGELPLPASLESLMVTGLSSRQKSIMLGTISREANTVLLEPHGLASLDLGCPSILGQDSLIIPLFTLSHQRTQIGCSGIHETFLDHRTELFLSGTEMDQARTPFFKPSMYTHCYRLFIGSPFHHGPTFPLLNTGFHYSLGSQTVWLYLGVSITHRSCLPRELFWELCLSESHQVQEKSGWPGQADSHQRQPWAHAGHLKSQHASHPKPSFAQITFSLLWGNPGVFQVSLSVMWSCNRLNTEAAGMSTQLSSIKLK